MQQLCENTDWSYLLDLDVSGAYANFTEKLNNFITEFAPEKTVVIPPKYIIREDWMTKGLIKSSKTLNKLYKKCIKKPKTHPAYDKYNDFRNQYDKFKKIAKHNYYEERFN